MELEREQQVSIESPRTLGGSGIINPDPRNTSTDLSQCRCNLPTLAVGEGEVGPFEEQVLYCSECGFRFCSIIPPLDLGEDDEEAES